MTPYAYVQGPLKGGDMAGSLLLTNLKRIAASLSQRPPENNEYSGRQISCKITAIFFLLAIIITLNVPSMNTGHTASNQIKSEEQEWRYFKGTGKPPQEWNHEEFDDSGWMKGRKGTGYGKKRSAFVLDDMKDRYRTVYARQLFNINDPQAILKMSLSVVCDGPFVAYLNGMPAIRNIMGLSTASPAGVSPIGEELDLSGWAHELNPGLNVLAIQCDNDDINSNDFLFIPSLKIIEGQDVK
jgi:hypothetical protein